MIQKGEEEYNNLLLSWILDVQEKGVIDFFDLLRYLLGVYPSVVLNSLKKLASENKILVENYKKARIKAVELTDKKLALEEFKPIPHPLDYDWRFSRQASDYILKVCFSIVPRLESIILLGVPTLLRTFISMKAPWELHFFDENSDLTELEHSDFGIKKNIEAKCYR